jgi:hemerythrin-like domain-containing protein
MAAFPGFDSPAVGFDAPFEMLAACHDRMRRSLGLLNRLVGHVDEHGHGETSRSAASDILRYFDLAAPLHHQDEELHVFPLLSGGDDAVLAETIARLQSDHREMESLWERLRTLLGTWSRADALGVASDAARADVSAFAERYAAHLQIEERIVFPAARSRIGALRLSTMAADMQQRRRVTPSSA